MITVRNLSMVYRKTGETVVVFDNVNFSLDVGEFVIILGESGSGKTSLLNILGALDRPDAGEVLVEGVGDILKAKDKELSQYRNKVVGHVFQTFNLKPTYTARENVRVPLLFTRMDRGEQKDRVDAAIKAVGLWNRRSFKPIELSEGQCQRVAIARAIVNRPPILLADEPTGNLDPKTAENILELLIRLNSEKKMTLVMVTHDLNVLDYAHKVLVIEEGRIYEDGDRYWRTKGEKKTVGGEARG